jgi:hypothetical protein
MGSSPGDVIDFFNLPNHSSRTRKWGLLSHKQKLVLETERKMFLGNRARPARKAGNLNAICEPIV